MSSINPSSYDPAAKLNSEEREALAQLKTIYEGMRASFSALTYTNSALVHFLKKWGVNHHAGGVCDHLADLIGIIEDILNPNRDEVI